MLVSISKVWGGRGEFELRSRRGYTRRFLGRSGRSDDSELDIKRSPLCPQVGDLDPYDRLAVIRRVQVRLIDFTDREWEITVTSSTDVPEREISPLEKPAEISWDSDQFEATTVFDRDRRPVTNSAGDLVLFPYEDSRWVADVSKNVARVPRWITQFNNAINSGSISVDGIRFPKRTLMCKHLRIGTQQTTKLNDRDVTFLRAYVPAARPAWGLADHAPGRRVQRTPSRSTARAEPADRCDRHRW
ncbi:hypothetical protein Mal4_40130 [Maioricimonas rarisocia]|uniref:Uncharacterized protein n=1 Tax=Maioricimonas rarisocia TaxID=2528026 RepID=A0A517ZB33_9PLAN|nr:hypothetical protein [Maioricimonas rarisocia]QDU39667.1 hypothetical protein Mal4_40130 [Maioricimonas rarisocia]